MNRFVPCLCTACIALFAGNVMAQPKLTAAQIVDRYIAASGGSAAWHKIQTMVWLGHIDTGEAGMDRLPFVLQMQRPDKTRFDIRANNQQSSRIFDGAQGWNIRTAAMKRPTIQPFTAIELRTAHDSHGIDGALLDYKARHIVVALEGIEPVEGHPAYRLNVTLPSGTSHHEWIDTKSFLEVKSDRVTRNAFGMTGTVQVFYRNYRIVKGVQIPHLIESGSKNSNKHENMFIDRVLINPHLDKNVFTQPEGSYRQPPNNNQLWVKRMAAALHPTGTAKERGN